MRDCWGCRLAAGDSSEHKTSWFFRDEDGILVEDLHARGYKIRLLYVPIEHIPVGQSTIQTLTKGYEIAMGVARALQPEIGWGNAIWEVKDHSYRAHDHFQLCLR